jgi:hypothetical protein
MVIYDFPIPASTIARKSFAVLLVQKLGLCVWLKMFLICHYHLNDQGLTYHHLCGRKLGLVERALESHVFCRFDLRDLFPIIIIWNFNTPTHRKIDLASLVALSLLNMFSSITKTLIS